ncbi:MAG: glutamate 5-kinase [Oceanospirillales bacterium]|uniref:Glutamate 5-kinase n=1 Tax=Marinobacterium halophilum TaxID=267374 RepID=A0A2P8EXZ0_9GAMM|nr:glutamate 5-kinase [Marinobacterium halophilum]MBR9827424.1 glutamate 5-kinase [Oceanospirillales bacterium]PSL14295.1 glutamate 5-kinase [Marinobacterium halophilum]
MTAGRKSLAQSGRWVVKIGSALLTNDGQGLDQIAIAGWVDQLVELTRRGVEVVLVSSGSVAEGMTRLGWSERPPEVYRLQAAAAVGQMGLVQAYETNFRRHGLHTAQILLTHDDMSNRKRYLNARATLRTLIELGVVAVVNENDTVVTSEIRFGDNDTLGALVANAVEADALILLTDQSGLYTADPRSNPDAELIPEAMAGDERLDAMAGGGGKLGRGGMATKVRAAKLAARSGAVTVIASGREPDVLLKLHAAESVGTLLLPEREPMAARKQWIAGHLQARGTLVLDVGAVAALVERGKSLLPAGVRSVSGDFSRGEMVIMLDEYGRVIARGLANYGAEDARRIIGRPSSEIESLLGFMGEVELVHRDNLVLA